MKIFVIFYVIMFISFFYFSIYMHEKAHMEIYRHYGIKSEMHLSYNEAYVSSEEKCYTSECMLAHNLNEVVGYNIQGIYLIIGGGLFVIIIQIALIWEENK